MRESIVEVEPIPIWSVDLMTAFAPTWVADKDLHLLRNREATSDGNGSGFIARARTELVLGNEQMKFRPILAVTADYYSLAVHAFQTIYWYGDDPVTPGVNDTGTTMSDIPHQLVSRELFVGLRLGVRF